MKKKPGSRAVSIAASFAVALATAVSTGVQTNAATVAPVASAAPWRFTEASFAQIRTRHAGKPLVVHIWGMSCGPCLGELPKWGELRRTHPEINLVLIQADQSPAEVSEKTLQEAGLAQTETWAVDSEFDEYLRASIDPRWIGDMPRTLMISAGGGVERLRGVADLAQVRRWLSSNAKAHP